jgi:hypothetical protein
MTTTTITCDKCRCEIHADRTLMRIECGPIRHRRPEVDLCPACCELLETFLRNPEQQQEKQP